MPIAIDIRSIQDPRARGVSYYAGNVIDAMIRMSDADSFRLFAAGYGPAPALGAPVTHLRLPSKLVNAGMRCFGSPTLDGITGCKNVWMPNLNFWSIGSRAKLTVTVHDLSFLVEPTWFTPRERLWHRLLNARGLLKRADALITLSHHTKQELTELLDIDHERIHVIAPGIPSPHQPSPQPSPGTGEGDERSLPVGEENRESFPYILYLGALERRKNVVRAIQAFELAADRLPEMHFIIAGAPGAGFDEMKFRIQDSGFKNRIHLTGPVSPGEKSALLKGATAFFFPSLYEGFGFPPLEAMSAGIPVVASAAGALPETIGNAAILLDPLDTGGFADALVAACTDTALRQTLIARGYERVKQFSWKHCAKETYKIIKD